MALCPLKQRVSCGGSTETLALSDWRSPATDFPTTSPKPLPPWPNRFCGPCRPKIRVSCNNPKAVTWYSSESKYAQRRGAARRANLRESSELERQTPKTLNSFAQRPRDQEAPLDA